MKVYPLLRRIYWVNKSVKAITLFLEYHNMNFILVQYIKYVLIFVNKMKPLKS